MSAKPETETLMKNCGVKTEDVQPKLNIHKLAGKKVSQETRDYESLFSDDSNEPSSKRRGTQQRKILLKGPLGSGKSLVARKVQRHCFAAFSVVFFIIAKLITPGEAIENVIVEQYALAKEDKKKILDILKNHDRKCCLIFDGVETMNAFEHGVLRVIQDDRFSECDIIVTSDIPETNNIEKYFDTVCETQVLTVEDARSLISDIVKNEDRVETILNCKVSGPNVCPFSEEYNPMVLSFHACLVKNRIIHGDKATLTLGSLFAEIVKFICKGCSGSSLIDVLTMVGTICLDLLQGKRLFLHETDEDVKALDSVVFDSGLLVRLGNGFVTSCHKSMDVFLATVYLITYLSKTGNLTDILESDPDIIIVSDQVFLYFCLSLIDNPAVLDIPNPDIAKQALQKFVLKNIEHIQLGLSDFTEMYPALNIASERRNIDSLVKNFFLEVLSLCTKIKILVLNSKFPFLEILSKMKHQLATLTRIEIGDYAEPYQVGIPAVTREGELDIVLSNLTEDDIKELLTTLQEIQKTLCIYLLSSKTTMLDISILFKPEVGRIHIHQMGDQIELLVENEIGPCPKLKHLHFSSPYLKHDEETFSAIASAVQKGHLPNISHLSLVGLSEVDGLLPILLESPWPNLQHLDLSETNFDQREDFDCLRKHVFHKLTSLSIYDPDIAITSAESISGQLEKLQTLQLKYNGERTAFCQSLSHGKLQNITGLKLLTSSYNIDKVLPTLKIPHVTSLKLAHVRPGGGNIRAISKHINLTNLVQLDITSIAMENLLSSLLRKKLPKLETLILSFCELMTGDFECLVDANKKGNLPRLQYLNLSNNPNIADEMNRVFAEEKQWGKLTKLDVSCDRKVSQDIFPLLLTKAESLLEIRELTCSVKNVKYLPNQMKQTWSDLSTIKLDLYIGTDFDVVLKSVIQFKKDGWFPSLETVVICSCARDWTPTISAVKHELRSQGIILQFSVRESRTH